MSRTIRSCQPISCTLRPFMSHQVYSLRTICRSHSVSFTVCIAVDTAAHCNTLQHAATHCNTLQHLDAPIICVTNCVQMPLRLVHRIHVTSPAESRRVQHHGHISVDTATHCNTLQHPATSCNTLQHPSTHLHNFGSFGIKATRP